MAVMGGIMSGVKHTETIRVTAKDRHRTNLLAYLSEWGNKFPDRKGMAKICGITRATLTGHFSPDELNQILADGLELRKKHSAVQRSEVYDAMHKCALDGSVQAQEKFLERTEGKVTDKIEHTGKNGGPIKTVNMPPTPKSLAEWEQQVSTAAAETQEKTDNEPK